MLICPLPPENLPCLGLFLQLDNENTNMVILPESVVELMSHKFSLVGQSIASVSTMMASLYSVQRRHFFNGKATTTYPTANDMLAKDPSARVRDETANKKEAVFAVIFFLSFLFCFWFVYNTPLVQPLNDLLILLEPPH